jgi:tripartite-type tricarboxylate transporter receptor subunit TctC
MTIKFARVVSALVLSIAAPLACAQWAPTKPVRIVVPFPSGGILDQMARTVTDKLGAALGQAVIVDARPGANGSIGIEAAARADADGHTILFATLTNVTLPAFMKVPWHPTKDFAGVAMFAQVPNVAVVPTTLEPRTLREFVEYAKARPGQLNYANAGNGSSQTLGVELLKKNTGIDLVSVGYKGFPPAVPDLITGRLQFALMPFGVAAPQVKAGKLRALALAAPARNRQLPDVPTMAEAGFPESPVISWYAFVAPVGTPKAAIERLNAEFARALADPEVVARIETLGGSPLPVGTPAELDAMMAKEVQRWSVFVKETGLTIQ